MKESLNPSSINSKNEISKALLYLMKIHPYHDITVKQIVLETSLVRKTFYRNFSSKDDVLNSYIESLLFEYIRTVIKPKSNILSVIFDFCLTHKELLQLLYKNNILYLLLQNMNRVIPNEHAKSENIIQNSPFDFGNLNPEYIISFNVGAIYNVIVKWVERGMIDPPAEIKAALQTYLMNDPLRKSNL